jgi:hypothetical protein
MSTDKSLAIRLLDAFEYYFFENACLRLILQQRHVPGWERALGKLMSDDELSASLRGRFSSIRAACAAEGSEAEALQQLLAVFPPNKDLN